jgi:hypothetical protein
MREDRRPCDGTNDELAIELVDEFEYNLTNNKKGGLTITSSVAAEETIKAKALSTR